MVAVWVALISAFGITFTAAASVAVALITSRKETRNAAERAIEQAQQEQMETRDERIKLRDEKIAHLEDEIAHLREENQALREAQG